MTVKLITAPTNATSMSFAQDTLQQDYIRFLTAINNEAKLRRSTKLLVLGKAKVISYEDLVAKRCEREAKEQVKTQRRRKRGRKHANQTEANTSKSVIDEQFEENEAAAEELHRAPVAQMW